MANAYRDLTEFYDPDLYLPIDGVPYRVQQPGRTEVDRLSSTIYADTFTEEQERVEINKALGDTLGAMIDADLPDSMIHHAGRTALIHFTLGAEAGRAHWHLAQLSEKHDGVAILEKLLADAAVESESSD